MLCQWTSRKNVTLFNQLSPTPQLSIIFTFVILKVMFNNTIASIHTLLGKLPDKKGFSCV